MRMSDWSSDVCSSDLSARARKFGRAHRVIVKVIFRVALVKGCCRGEVGAAQVHADNRLQSIDILAGTGRSEERRVGKEGVSTCRSRWSPDHKNKKHQTCKRYTK